MTASNPPGGYLGIITGQQLTDWSQGSVSFAATTAAIGGSVLTTDTSVTGNVAVTGATTAMPVVVSPVTYPGAVNWKGYVVAADIVQVVVTNTSSSNVTPTSTPYNVRVIK